MRIPGSLVECLVEGLVFAPDEADVEGHESEPAPDSVVVAVDLRPMVRNQDDLELRDVLEELAIEEPGRDAPATGYELQCGLVEPPAFG